MVSLKFSQKIFPSKPFLSLPELIYPYAYHNVKVYVFYPPHQEENLVFNISGKKN